MRGANRSSVLLAQNYGRIRMPKSPCSLPGVFGVADISDRRKFLDVLGHATSPIDKDVEIDYY